MFGEQSLHQNEVRDMIDMDRKSGTPPLRRIRKLARSIFRVGVHDVADPSPPPSARSKVIRNGYENVLFNERGIKYIEEELPEKTGLVYEIIVLPDNGFHEDRP